MSSSVQPHVIAPAEASPTDAPRASGLLPALAVALVFAAFAPALVRMGRTWWFDPEYSHGLLMPFVAAWLLWDRREGARALRGGTSLLALPLLVVCLAAGITAELDFLISLAPYAFVGALGAVVLAFYGWRGLAWSFPVLVVLLLGCPLPGPVLERLTLPLKTVASQLAVGLLNVTGIQTFLDGNVITLPGTESLLVADACSGIRSLISLVSLAVLACLVWKRHWVVKLLVVAAAVPIAIVVNGLRIWLTGYLTVRVSPEAAAGAFHLLEGFVLFAVAGLLLWGFTALVGLVLPKDAS